MIPAADKPSASLCEISRTMSCSNIASATCLLKASRLSGPSVIGTYLEMSISALWIENFQSSGRTPSR